MTPTTFAPRIKTVEASHFAIFRQANCSTTVGKEVPIAPAKRHGFQSLHPLFLVLCSMEGINI
ncbi:unnamed protein product [Musa textilis]